MCGTDESEETNSFEQADWFSPGNNDTPLNHPLKFVTIMIRELNMKKLNCLNSNSTTCRMKSKSHDQRTDAQPLICTDPKSKEIPPKFADPRVQIT